VFGSKLVKFSADAGPVRLSAGHSASSLFDTGLTPTPN
jgi:hypothetical protein